MTDLKVLEVEEKVENKTNYTQSVTAVVFKDERVLVARHTYGVGKNRLIIPGGFVEFGERPEDAVKREYMEETGIVIEPKEVIGIRFNNSDWYVAFSADYVSGEARSDGDENSELLWLTVEELMANDDVPDLTKKLVECALSGKSLGKVHYDGSLQWGAYQLYGAK